MRVTFILPELPLSPSGGARVVYEYANGLAARGHNVTLLHPRSLLYPGLNNSPLVNLWAKLKGFIKSALSGFAVYPVSVSWQTISPDVTSLSVPLLWPRFIPNGDIVIATFWRTAEYVTAYPGRCGEKFYLIQHHEVTMGPEHRVNKTWILPLKKIVIAKWLMTIGQKMGATDLYYVPNAIDHKNFYLTNAIEGRALRVVMMYSPFAWKGSKEGISALIEAKKKLPALGAVLFGVHARPSHLPDWIEYIENPAQETLRDEIYNKSSIYLCSSWSEGWGLPVLEAMACGCAIVTTDNGGVGDFVVDRETGLIVKPKDIQEMTDAITSISLDRGLQNRFATYGHSKALHFTYAKSLEQLETLLINTVK